MNAREGLNWAILVGDYLLAVAGIQAASVSKEVAHSLARTIADLAAAKVARSPVRAIRTAVSPTTRRRSGGRPRR